MIIKPSVVETEVEGTLDESSLPAVLPQESPTVEPVSTVKSVPSEGLDGKVIEDTTLGKKLREGGAGKNHHRGSVGNALFAQAKAAALPHPEVLDDPELSPPIRELALSLMKRWQFDAQVLGQLEVTLEMWPEYETHLAREDSFLRAKLLACTPPGDVTGNPVLPTLKVAALQCNTVAHDTALANPMAAVESAMGEGADIVVAPEWFFSKPGEGAFSEAEMQDMLTQLRKMSAGSDTLMVPGTIRWKDDAGNYFNSAYAFCGGQIVKRYDKRTDGDDNDFAKLHNLSWVPGEQDGGFNWRGRRVALEVCRDHADAMARIDGETVDLHVVVSAGVDATHPTMGRGGVFVLAQGDPSFPATEVFRRPLEKKMAGGMFFEAGENVYDAGKDLSSRSIDSEISLQLVSI